MQAPKKRTLGEAAYERLRSMILIGDLRPGSRLTETELAPRLEVSRTPLREALRRLDRDGLVTGKPRHGYYVRKLDLKALEDACDVREVLDSYAAQCAAEIITESGKARLRDLVQRCEALAENLERDMESLAEELQLGLDIHRVIAEATGNALLQETLSRILDKFQHFIWIELLWLNEWSVAREEHAAIVDAICVGDGARAAELARRHVRGSRDNILQLLRAKTTYRVRLVTEA